MQNALLDGSTFANYATVFATLIAAGVYYSSVKTAQKTFLHMDKATQSDLRAYLHMKSPQISYVNLDEPGGLLKLNFRAKFENFGRTPAYMVYGDIGYRMATSQMHRVFSKGFLLDAPEQYQAIGAGETGTVECHVILEREDYQALQNGGGHLELRIWVSYVDIFGMPCTFCMHVRADILWCIKEFSENQFVEIPGVYTKPDNREIFQVSTRTPGTTLRHRRIRTWLQRQWDTLKKLVGN